MSNISTGFSCYLQFATVHKGNIIKNLIMDANLTQSITQTRLRAVFLYLGREINHYRTALLVQLQGLFFSYLPINTFSTGTGTVRGIEAESSSQRTPFAVTGRAQHDTVSTVYEKRCP